MTTEQEKPKVDFRNIRYKGLNKIITIGWSTFVTIMLVPFYVYALYINCGFNLFMVAVFFPLGILITSIATAQIVVVMVFVGLRLHKFIFRKST